MTIELFEAFLLTGGIAGLVALALHFRKSKPEAAKVTNDQPATVGHVSVIAQKVDDLTNRLNLTTQIAALARDVQRNHEDNKVEFAKVHDKLDGKKPEAPKELALIAKAAEVSDGRKAN